MSSRSRNKPRRENCPVEVSRQQWRALRRAPGPLDHETGERFAEDQSTTKAVKNRMNRVFWNLRGLVPPPMDAEGRPIDNGPH